MPISAEIPLENGFHATSRWTAEHVAGIADAPLPEPPTIGPTDIPDFLPGCDLWDLWPLQNPDGSVASIGGGELWMALSAPRLADPDMRHDIARTRMLHRKGGKWHDCGLLFPGELNPGTREWSGCARLDAASGIVTACFTAAGRREEEGRSFEQRLFQTSGRLDLSGVLPRIHDWTPAVPLAENDGTFYADVRRTQGAPGNIKGFRDPYWLRDPADGHAYILFTGSEPTSLYSHDGVIGIARAKSGDGADGFDLLPPVISADGLCNELERPHLVIRDGLYYLFWSSQHSVFAANGPKGPTGLYGMAGRSLTGPYAPLNGTGLVIANPAAEPRQAYCWQVTDRLEVYSFIDHWGLRGRDISADPDLRRGQFGGTMAPVLKIDIDGHTTRLLGLA